MSEWPSTRARRLLAALLKIGWRVKRQTGSHRTLSREGWPDVALAFHDTEMRRTKVEIDDALLQKAMRLTGVKSKREAVDIALRRLVRKGSLYRSLRRLRGKLAWEGDVRAWRSARTTQA